MAHKLKAKLLRQSDEHQDCCFITIYDSLHLIIANKHRLSIHSIDTDIEDNKDNKDNEEDNISNNINANCIIDNIPIKYQSKIKEIITVKKENWIQNVFKTCIDTKYECYASILSQWDSILILFENGYFGWFYIDIDNEIIINDKENDFILWLIAPNRNYKYDEFINQLTQKSQSLPLIINDWNIRSIYIKDKDNENMQCMILAIFSLLGNVIMFIPIIWKNRLCFKYLSDNNKDNEDMFILLKTKNDKNGINALWQIRTINGMIWDFQFIRTKINNINSICIHFILLYSQQNKSKILSDSLEIFENNKLIINKAVNTENIRNISIFNDKPYKIQLNVQQNQQKQKFLIPIELSSWNTNKLQQLLNDDGLLMMMSHQHSINIEILKRIIQNEIIIRNNNKITNKSGYNDNSLKIIYNAFTDLYPKQIIILSDYDGLIIFDFIMIYYEESPYDHTKTETYKLPLIRSNNMNNNEFTYWYYDENNKSNQYDVIMDDMIINVKYEEKLSIILIATYNGNIYYMNLDGIRHQKKYKEKQSDLIEYKLLCHIKYVNINEILLQSFNDLMYGFIFGQLSSHQLFLIPNVLNKDDSSDIISQNLSIFIPQYNGIMDVIKSKTHKSFSDEDIYIAYGYNKGGCIAKYSCIIPTESVLDEPQKGYEYLSKILNVNNTWSPKQSLLIFVIADETRIRCLSDGNLPELEIKDFQTNIQTLAVGYITSNIILQITTNALLIIHTTTGILTDFSTKYDDNSNITITYAEIQQNYVAVITTKKVQSKLHIESPSLSTANLYVHQLNIYQLSQQHMIELIHSIQLKDSISCLKIITNNTSNNNLIGIIVGTYSGTLEIYDCKSTIPILYTSLNKLPFVPHIHTQSKQSLKPKHKTKQISLFAKIEKKQENDDDDIEANMDVDDNKEKINDMEKENSLSVSSSSQFTEPQENIVAQSITIIDFDEKQQRKLYIGTRNGWLVEYDLISKQDDIKKDIDDDDDDDDMDSFINLNNPEISIINTKNPVFRNIGELPVHLVPIQVNIDDQEVNDLNMTQFRGKNALLCISERCWIIFLNQANKLELWPLDYPPNNVSYAISFNQDGESYLILIVNGCMDIVRVILEPRLHSFYTKIGKTVTQIRDLEALEGLLYITKNRDCQDVNKYDSILNFVDKDELFYNNNLRMNGIVEYEASLSECIVTDINIIDCMNNNNFISYLIGCNLVFKAYFKKCMNPSITLIKLDYDKSLKKFVKFNELYRYNLSEKQIILTPIPYKIISFKIADILEPIILISMGSDLLFFAVQNECKLVDCGSSKLSDFIKDIIYDSKTGLLSILYEKNGIDIMNVRINNGNDAMLEILNIIKSWNGILYSSTHLLLNCVKNEKNVLIETLICDRMGNISLMTNINNDENKDEEKNKSDDNHILQYKYSLNLDVDKNRKCCFKDMVKYHWLHNKGTDQIIIICNKGCVFQIHSNDDSIY